MSSVPPSISLSNIAMIFFDDCMCPTSGVVGGSEHLESMESIHSKSVVQQYCLYQQLATTVVLQCNVLQCDRIEIQYEYYQYNLQQQNGEIQLLLASQLASYGVASIIKEARYCWKCSCRRTVPSQLGRWPWVGGRWCSTLHRCYVERYHVPYLVTLQYIECYGQKMERINVKS